MATNVMENQEQTQEQIKQRILLLSQNLEGLEKGEEIKLPHREFELLVLWPRIRILYFQKKLFLKGYGGSIMCRMRQPYQCTLTDCGKNWRMIQEIRKS